MPFLVAADDPRVMGNKRVSKFELLSAAQALLRQDERERMRFLLKTGLFRSKRAEIPVKASMWVEGLVIFTALILGGAIVFVVLAQFRHG